MVFKLSKRISTTKTVIGLRTPFFCLIALRTIADVKNYSQSTVGRYRDFLVKSLLEYICKYYFVNCPILVLQAIFMILNCFNKYSPPPHPAKVVPRWTELDCD
jgi:hypothetical protein